MYQMSLFDGNAPFIIDKPVRLIELFAGIGSQAKAMEVLRRMYGIEWQRWGVIEWEQKAVDSYNVLHNMNEVAQDITKITANDLGIVDTDKYCYLMTYSFPCTDLSLAGLQQGMAKDSGTRSSLLWEVERILNECTEGQSSRLPQVLLMENVPQVASGSNGEQTVMDGIVPISNGEYFDEWKKFLTSKGYKNYGKILNAKDYGIPQSRRRYFMISILGDYYFTFPKSKKLTITMANLLERQVDPKYYITDKKIKTINSSTYVTNTRQIQDKDICDTLCARDNKDPKCVVVAELDTKSFSICNKVYDTNALAPTLLAQGNSTITKVVDRPKVIAELDTEVKTFGDRAKVYDPNALAPTLTCAGLGGGLETKILERCEVIGHIVTHNLEMHNRVYNSSGLCPTLTTQTGGGLEKKVAELSGRVRKLTPKEYWRLMGFEDADYDKASKIHKKTTLYTQAGNSIVVSVLIAIFGELLGLDTSKIEYDTNQFKYTRRKEV